MPLNNPYRFRHSLGLLELSVAYPLLFGDIHAFFKNKYGSQYSFIDADFRTNASAAVGYKLLLPPRGNARYCFSVNINYLEAMASDLNTDFAAYYNRELNVQVKCWSFDAMVTTYQLLGGVPLSLGLGTRVGSYHSKIFASPEMMAQWTPYINHGTHLLACGLLDVGVPLSKVLRHRNQISGLLIVSPYARFTLGLNDKADGYVYNQTDAIPEVGLRVSLNLSHWPKLFSSTKKKWRSICCPKKW